MSYLSRNCRVQTSVVMFIPSWEILFCDVRSEFEMLYSFCVLLTNNAPITRARPDFHSDVDIAQSELPYCVFCIVKQLVCNDFLHK